ncbi:MAG: hypothetical protein U0361_03175 [Nitrospiraceae bacterium]
MRQVEAIQENHARLAKILKELAQAGKADSALIKGCAGISDFNAMNYLTPARGDYDGPLLPRSGRPECEQARDDSG